MSKTVVIYHRADFDGIFCREIAKKFLPDTELIGWDYGDPEPVVAPETQLYILDLSVPGLMSHPNLVWIDHHKSAIERYSPKIVGYRIDGVAACRLAWQWFSSDHTDLVIQYNGLPNKQAYIDRVVSEPSGVQLAGEYDIWDRRNPAAQTFQHGLRSEVLDWNLLLSQDHYVCNNYCTRLLGQGAALEFARKNEDASLSKHTGFTLQFEGLCFIALNTVKCNSLTFAAAVLPKHDGCLAFGWTGKHWKISLYGVDHKPDVDLSKIAIAYGGGGHKQACGFTSKELPFIL